MRPADSGHARSGPPRPRSPRATPPPNAPSLAVRNATPQRALARRAPKCALPVLGARAPFVFTEVREPRRLALVQKGDQLLEDSRLVSRALLLGLDVLTHLRAQSTGAAWSGGFARMLTTHAEGTRTCTHACERARTDMHARARARRRTHAPSRAAARLE